MSRIRTVKPEFWTAGQVLECSTNARLLFIGLWNFCDDHGRHAYRAKQVKAEVFPADDFTEADILSMLGELERNDLIRRYTVDGKEYFHITGWHHQRIDKPQSPKHPGPEQDNSRNDLGTVPPEGKGRDSKRKEGKKEGGADAPAAGYGFVGHVGRVKQADLDQWAASYHAVPDILAELRAADNYYAENPPKDGKWFFPFSQWLKREHDKRMAERAAAKREDELLYRGVL